MTHDEYAPGGAKYAAKRGDADPTLEKVRSLWQSSQDESYPEDVREAYRTKAEALMFMHRITLAEAQQAGTNLDAPEWRLLRVCTIDSGFQGQYKAIVSALVDHASVRGVFQIKGDAWFLRVVGFPSDLGYMELLFTSSLLAFGSKLEPKWDPSLPLEENVYRMRSAGMERGRIARLAWPEKYVGQCSDYVNKPLNIKISNIFKEMAAKYGDDPSVLLGRGNNVATFRKSYAEAFVNELWRRLWRMKNARGNDTRAVVLAATKDVVDEAFYQEYPYHRPRPPQPGEDTEYRPPNADCERCKIAKSGYCRTHQYLKPSNAKPKERPYSAAGAARGEVAAQSVDLGYQHTAPVTAHSNYRGIAK